jgi:DNA-directed RNA polymerase subunit RPC12/RpoP
VLRAGHKLPAVALSNRWSRRPAPAAAPAPAGRKVARYEAGRYIGCPTCGRLLKIEWAVRSLVCSCGARIPVTLPDGKRT